MSGDTDELRWRAVLARDRSADGGFVYAVSSTGIYCRPSCPSRRPRRSVVGFFDAPGDAERAGFRACRRCRPDASDPWVDKIRRACVYLANVDGHPSLVTLARRVGGSPYHLQRHFKRLVGLSPREYADACRLKKVKRSLRNGAAVTGAVLDAGYGSSSRFYERAASRLGMSPSAYRLGGPDSSIRYAISDSPLGRLLVAATPRGVCAVSMGRSDEELRSALTAEYPAATLTADEATLGKWTREILARLGGREPRIDLPIDVRATAFQWLVWDALTKIPSGETRSYGAVAEAIGHPGAARAVAKACASNRVAIAIPCHRVVPVAGGVGGYRWGAERKKALIARERSPAQSKQR